MTEPASLGSPAAMPSPPATAAPPAAPDALPRAAFAHASEAEMSRILDFYGVAWRYEPTTFPILWNLEGDVVESFAPDFYLPEFDLYLEMTTLKQSLVRKKNRKLRRLRELYPDVRIKLFYARDFRAMMLKYGRLGLASSLTGTSGQLVGGEPIGAAAADPEPEQPEVSITVNARGGSVARSEPVVLAPRSARRRGIAAVPPIAAGAVAEPSTRARPAPHGDPR